MELYDSKLVQFCTLLDPQEQALVSKYLHSKVIESDNSITRHKTNGYYARKNWLLFYETIIAWQNDGSINTRTKMDLWQKVYGSEEVYSEKTIKLLMSDLAQQLEKWVVLHQINNSDAVQQQLLFEFYAQKSASKFLEAQWRQLLQQQKKHHNINDVAHLKQAFEWAAYRYQTDIVQNGRAAYNHINDVISNFWTYSHLVKLQYTCALLQAQQSVGLDQNTQQLIAELSNSNYATIHPKIAAIEGYTYAMQLLNPNESNKNEYFKQLLEIVTQNEKSISDFDLRQLFAIATSYATNQINKGNAELNRYLFELYNNWIQNGNFIREQYIAIGHYINIVKVALNIGEINWTKQFIAHYKTLLPENSRSQIFEYCEIITAFSEYEQNAAAHTAYDHLIIKCLQKTNLPDPMARYWYRIVLLKIYFKQNDAYNFDILCNSFKDLLKNDSNSPPQAIHGYLKFIEFIKKIFNKRFKQAQKPAALIQNIEQSDNLAEKIWLLRQLK
jgi:hypothetical protein